MYVENRTKIANFPTPVYLTPPLKGFPWNCVSAQGSPETRMMGLPDGSKSFKIGLAVLIQYRCVTDTQLPSQTRCRSKDTAYYDEWVKITDIICLHTAGNNYLLKSLCTNVTV